MTRKQSEETGATPVQPETHDEGAGRGRLSGLWRILRGRKVLGSGGIDPYRATTFSNPIPEGQRNAARREREAEEGLRATPRVACAKRGCRRPWEDHLTKKGNLRSEFKAGHRSTVEDRQSRMGRNRRRQMGVGGRPGHSNPAGFTLSRDPNHRRRIRRRADGSWERGERPRASIQTHIVVMQNGKKIRMPLEKYQELLLEAGIASTR